MTVPIVWIAFYHLGAFPYDLPDRLNTYLDDSDDYKETRLKALIFLLLVSNTEFHCRVGVRFIIYCVSFILSSNPKDFLNNFVPPRQTDRRTDSIFLSVHAMWYSPCMRHPSKLLRGNTSPALSVGPSKLKRPERKQSARRPTAKPQLMQPSSKGEGVHGSGKTGDRVRVSSMVPVHKEGYSVC